MSSPASKSGVRPKFWQLGQSLKTFKFMICHSNYCFKLLSRKGLKLFQVKTLWRYLSIYLFFLAHLFVHFHSFFTISHHSISRCILPLSFHFLPAILFPYFSLIFILFALFFALSSRLILFSGHQSKITPLRAFIFKKPRRFKASRSLKTQTNFKTELL